MPLKTGNSVDFAPAPLTPEKGVEVEGYFDAVKPFKEAAIQKIKEKYPHEKKALLAELLGHLVPDSPLDVAFIASNASAKLKNVLQSMKAPIADQAIKGITDKTIEKFAGKKIDQAAAAVAKPVEKKIVEGFPGLVSETTDAVKSFGDPVVKGVQNIKRADALRAFGIKGPPITK